MATFLDDMELDATGPSLGDVLQVVSNRLAPEGRLVVEVRLDGQTLSGEQLSQHQDQPVANSDLRLYSADPKDLVEATLGQAGQELRQIRQDQDTASQLLQQDDSKQALEHMGRAIEGWLRVQQAVARSTQLLDLSIADKDVDGQPVTQIVGSLIEQLKQIRELVSAADTVGLADILAYEWPQNVMQWERLLEEIGGWIHEQKR